MACIEHVALFAADPHALKDFYADAFGLRVVLDNSKASPPGYFLADDAGVAVELIGRPEGVPGADTRWICHIAFIVEDVAAARTDLEARGVVFEQETAVDNEAMTTAFFRDPEGNRLQIVSRPRPLVS
ncbi:VOC family protein [Tautonia plasticadhaerens]|uniref:Putative lyase n=1 Tax=Tautonia plasticadhaerens TaxID=2527974 RepID=A0A518GX57_9BACT|nr:VOC family protein [Tautonia plasticadhaerens]QDV33153.1 putative lyase [Tautonia plasticadhaerens]